MRRSPLRLAAVPTLLLALVASAGLAPTPSAAGSAPPPPPDGAARAVAIDVRTYVSGLSHPWDIKPLGDGRMLMTERNPARLSLVTSGNRTTVDFPTGSVWQAGETGLMGLEVDPGFASNQRFYTCSGWRLSGGRHDIRVQSWRLVGDRAERVRVLLAGLPTTTGRHGGCRLLITRGGALLVGTGDAAVGRNPRNQQSLGGKVLRLDRTTGKPHRHNPWVRAAHSVNRRYVYSFGHRNVQGLAERRDGTVWSVEHGSYRDDEVNRVERAGDYGWHPVPGYDESVPMTDQRLPGRQVGARWRSGQPTLATSGASWVYSTRWGSLNGTLAVAALKAQRVVFMRFDAGGVLRGTSTPAALRGIDRLRTVETLPNGNLLVLTDGDAGAGRVLLVVPGG